VTPATDAREWSTACPDWERRILAGQSLIPLDPLFPDEAAAALAVFNELRLVDVVGSPPLGEICRPWITDFVAAIFGAYDAQIGRRLINEFFLCVSKKNSKSSIAAAIMLTALIRNWRKSAEYIIVAPTVEIATNSFLPAQDMVRADDELSRLFHVQAHYRTITHRVSGAMLKVLAADSDTVGGKKASGILIDELYLFGSKPYAENMFREAAGGLASRPEGFVIYLSTQSDDPPAGIFRQKLMYARGVRDGRIKDKRFLSVLYEFPERLIKAGAHLLPENFGATNPNLGLSVDNEFLERELTKAQEAGEESVRGFAAKHLNVEVGLALQTNLWPGVLFWEQQGCSVNLDDVLARCEVITIGIDGGGLDDMLAVAVVGREAITGKWLHWAHAWIHPIVLERRKSEAARFRDFEKHGDLTIVEYMGQDVEQVADVVEQCEASELLDRIGVDAAGIGAIVDAIVGKGIAFERVVGVSQGWRLVGAIKTLERKLAEGSLLHGASPLMAWSVGNARCEPRGNAVIITKQQSGTAKIDPLMATFDAIALMAMNPTPRKTRYQMFKVN
jgi:phage terminase large subunit-like protein